MASQYVLVECPECGERTVTESEQPFVCATPELHRRETCPLCQSPKHACHLHPDAGPPDEATPG